VPSPKVELLAPRCATVSSSMDWAYAICVASRNGIPLATTPSARWRLLMALLARGNGEVMRELANLTKERQASANRHAASPPMKSGASL